MPFKQQPPFIAINDENKKLWRYLSLSKFISLLQTKSLFLTNLDQLIRGDPFEGALPNSHFVHRNWKNIDDLPQEIRGKLNNYLRKEDYGNELLGFQNLLKLRNDRIKNTLVSRKSYFINCWHINTIESFAMWEIYSDKNEGIAIKTSERKLQESLRNEKKDIQGGKVSYGDFEDHNFKIDEMSGFSPILNKRSSYSYENEYRLIYWDTSVTHNYAKNGVLKSRNQYFKVDSANASAGKSYEDIEATEVCKGIQIQCDIEHLLEDVYVSPLAQDWFKDLVQDLIYKYGLNLEVKRSKLLDQPLK